MLNPLQKRMLAARRMLATRGFNECVTWAFLPEAQAKLFGGGQPELKLANPISSELSDMRPSLLPNLIAAAGRNMARGFGDVPLCEVGHAYAGDSPQDETLRAGGVRRGAVIARNVQGGARAVDAFDAKADALAVIEASGACSCHRASRAGRAGLVSSRPLRHHPDGPAEQACLFRRNPSACLAGDGCEGARWLRFEVILNALPPPSRRSLRARPWPFPTCCRSRVTLPLWSKTRSRPLS